MAIAVDEHRPEAERPPSSLRSTLPRGAARGNRGIGSPSSASPEQLQREGRSRPELHDIRAARREVRALEEFAVEEPACQSLDREPAAERPLEAHGGPLVEHEEPLGVEPPMLYDFEGNEPAFQPKAAAQA
jgi:hypothetical protein